MRVTVARGKGQVMDANPTWYKLTRFKDGLTQSSIVHCSFLATKVAAQQANGYAVAHEPTTWDGYRAAHPLTLQSPDWT